MKQHGEIPGLEDLEPWLQQNGEGNEAYASFCVYRDMGPQRSIDKAYQQQLSNTRAAPLTELVMRASGRWTAWSTTWSWTRRALAYDRRLQRVEHRNREWLIAQNGINWAEERELDLRERLETYRNLRRGLKHLTLDCVVIDTRKKLSRQNEDGSWVSAEEKIRISEQFRIMRDLQKTLFPPDDMDVTDEWGNKWSKFTPSDTVIVAGEEDPAEDARALNAEQPKSITASASNAIDTDAGETIG